MSSNEQPAVIPKKTATRNGKNRSYTMIVGADGSVNIPTFDAVQVSTMTIIAHTNLIVNTDKFFKFMPYTDWTMVRKKRGRKRKIQPDDPNKDIPAGSIISLTKKRCVRGVVLKPKKKKSKTFFRHSVSVVMILEGGKMLNVKVSRNGKLQMTGAKTLDHAVDFMKHMYDLMIQSEAWTGETLFTYKTDNDDVGDEPEDEVAAECSEPMDLVETETPLERAVNAGLCVVFRCVMRNIDFGVGFRVRRDLLDKFINLHTDFRSIFEASVGTSVNVKLEVANRSDPQLVRLRITGQGECIDDHIAYEDFFKTLSAKDQRDERRKQSYHTFLVFASGSVIMSSAGGDMPLVFYKFVKMLVENRKFIEEGDDSKIIESKWLEDDAVIEV